MYSACPSFVPFTTGMFHSFQYSSARATGTTIGPELLATLAGRPRVLPKIEAGFKNL
jgi:hypothetical protein